MKLELRQIITYLPYGLSFFEIKSKKIYLCSGLNNSSLFFEGLKTSRNLWEVKPILRPMSDLPDDIFSDFGFADEEDFLICLREGRLNYSDMIKLISQHFDVFGLIESGLAIDINTVPELLNG